MKLKTLPLVVGAVICGLATTPVDAALIDYSISGTLSDGGSFAGMFTLDTGAPDLDSRAEIGTFANLPAAVSFSDGLFDGQFADVLYVSQLLPQATELLFLSGQTGMGLGLSISGGGFSDPNVLAPLGGELSEARDSRGNPILDLLVTTKGPAGSVPDGGSSLLMFGLALAGLAAGVRIQRRS